MITDLANSTPPDPPRFTVTTDSGGLTVSWPWWQWPHFFMLPFAIFWFWMLYTWFSPFLEPGNHLPVILALIAVPHALSGIAMVYLVIARRCNRTTVTCADGILSIRHGPLLWLGGRTLALRDIEALRVRVQTARMHGGTAYVPRYGHAIEADLYDTGVRLLSGLSETEARWLLDRLEALRRSASPDAVATGH